jgi:hypothetical protein
MRFNHVATVEHIMARSICYSAIKNDSGAICRRGEAIVSHVESRWARTIWGIADAHRGDGKRFVLHADEKLTEFCGT